MLAFMDSRYTFIFEVVCRDSSGRILPHEYRKKAGMTIKDARTYALDTERSTKICDG